MKEHDYLAAIADGATALGLSIVAILAHVWLFFLVATARPS